MRFLATLLLGLPLLGMSSAAIADDMESTGWDSHSFVVDFDGNGAHKKAKKKLFKSEAVYTNAEDIAGNVVMTCSNGVFSVGVALKPIDMEAFVEGDETTRRWRTRLIQMKIDGEKQRLRQWIYLPKFGIAKPRFKSDRSRIYNAARRGQTIMIDTDFKKPVQLILPEPNAKLEEFGAACGKGTRDHQAEDNLVSPDQITAEIDVRTYTVQDSRQ